MPQLGQLLSPIMGIVSGASGLYNSYENAQEANKARGIITDPRKFQQFAAGYTRPLAAGLTQGVANQTQGYAAERGLAESPALEQTLYAQAIAPYIQQEQNQGQQNALSVLDMMAGGGGSNPNAGGQLTSGLDALSQWYKNRQRQPFNSPVLPDYGAPPPPVPTDLTDWAYGLGGTSPNMTPFGDTDYSVVPEGAS